MKIMRRFLLTLLVVLVALFLGSRVVSPQNIHAQYPGLFTLSGRVFVDTNINGIQDGGEVGYSGGTTVTAAFVFIPGSFSATTDASGNYSMSIPQENYSVSLTVPAGYSPTTPSFIPLIAINALNPSPVINFGIVSTPLSASCSGLPNPATVGIPMAWTAVASGGVGGYSYSWSDGPPPDDLSGTSSSVTKTYSTVGPKSATVTVSSGAETRSATCSITVVPPPAWFQTIDGDVHARGGISAAITPPPGQFNAKTAKTVVVSHGGSVDANFRVESNWRIPTYPGSTTPYDYTYFFGRLGGGASTAPAIVDGLADGSSGIYQVSAPGNYVIATSGGGLDNVRAVIFVPGDLTITSNFTPPPTTSVAFIVRGTVTFSPSVTQFNGILVSGNAGPPATGGIGTGIGPGQLTLNGMMISYGGFTLGRWNATPSLPSELVQYNPRYIIELGNLLGTSSFVWEEVAP